MHEFRLTLFADALPYRFCNPRWGVRRDPLPVAELLAKADAVDRQHCQRVTLAGGSPVDHPDFDASPRGFLLARPVVSEAPAAARRLLAPYRAQAEVAARLFRLCQGNKVEYGFASRRGLLPCAAGGALDRFGTVFHERMLYFRH